MIASVKVQRNSRTETTTGALGNRDTVAAVGRHDEAEEVHAAEEVRRAEGRQAEGGASEGARAHGGGLGSLSGTDYQMPAQGPIRTGRCRRQIEWRRGRRGPPRIPVASCHSPARLHTY